MVNLWRPAGINNNYSNPANWSLLAVPTATDGNVATFDNNLLSGNCTVNLASVANNVDFSLYNKTITFTSTLTVSGNVTLGASMTFAGLQALIVSGNSIMTSNGKVMIIPLTLAGGAFGYTYTIQDNWNVQNAFTISVGGGVTNTINGNTGIEQISFKSFVYNSNLSTCVGTAKLRMTGTGTFAHTQGWLRCPVIFDAGANTITVSGTVGRLTGSFKYVGGTVLGTMTWGIDLNSGLSLDWGGSTTYLPIKLNGTAGNDISTVITLLSDVYLSGAISTGAHTPLSITGAYTWYQSGNIAQSTTSPWSASGGFLGMIWTGTQTWSGAVDSALSMSITINTAGTVTFASGNQLVYGGGTFTYTAGTVITTNTTFLVRSICTLNMNGMSLYNFSGYSSAATVTLTSNLNITNSFIVAQSVTFMGIGVFTCPTLSFTANIPVTMTLVSGQEYFATNVTIFSNNGAILSIVSGTSGVQAYLTFIYGGTMSIERASVKDINSSRGPTAWVWRPTLLSNTVNWNTLSVSSLQRSTAFL